MGRRDWKSRATRLALGIAIPGVLAGCASTPERADEPHLPTLRGRYELRATVRAGTLSREVRGVLTFLDGEWMTYEPGTGSGERVGPCRYREVGSTVEVDCGVSVRITGTQRGLVARVEQGLREVYHEKECVSWSTDASGRSVCEASRKVERYRMVPGSGEALLKRLEGY
jgi:hypothetical protein